MSNYAVSSEHVKSFSDMDAKDPSLLGSAEVIGRIKLEKQRDNESSVFYH